MKSPLNRGGLRFYLVIIALAAGTLIARTTTHFSILAGLPFLFLGIWLHTWAKGCLRQNCVVAMAGPYRFVRHPFYLSNALIDAGLVIMGGWWPLAAVLPLWWLAIYVPVIRGEEKYLAENFPDEYPQYKRRVPCLAPWRRPLPYTGEGFRWANPNIAHGEELPRAVRILAYPLLFFVAQSLRGNGLSWLDDGWNLAGLAALIMLYVLAWELQRHQRQRRWILPSALRRPTLRLMASTAVLAVLCCISTPATTFQNLMPAIGGALLLLSIPVFARRPVRAVAAEAVALMGAIAAGELFWLAPPLVAVYAAWTLDWQLRSTPAAGESSEPEAALPAAYWPWLYPLLIVASAAVIGAKLFGHRLLCSR